MAFPREGMNLKVLNYTDKNVQIGNRILERYEVEQAHFKTIQELVYARRLERRHFLKIITAIPADILEQMEKEPADTTPPLVSIFPNGGSFHTEQMVTLISDSPGETYYSIDGGTPSTPYGGPIAITASVVLKYYAVDAAGNESDVYTVSFAKIIDESEDTAPPVVTAIPNGGSFLWEETVTLTTNEPAQIYFSVDDSPPSIPYSGPITLIDSATISFFARDGAGNESPVEQAVFTLEETVTLNGGTFTDREFELVIYGGSFSDR